MSVVSGVKGLIRGWKGLRKSVWISLSVCCGERVRERVTVVEGYEEERGGSHGIQKYEHK